MTRSDATNRIQRALVGAIAAACIQGGTAAYAGEIHRCSGVEGVTYTDRGCSGSAHAVRLTVADAGPRDLHPAVDRDLAVTLGMSPRMVFDAIGRPIETIATLQGRQLIEYWLYRNAPGGVTRVAFHEGRVSSVHAR